MLAVLKMKGTRYSLGIASHVITVFDVTNQRELTQIDLGKLVAEEFRFSSDGTRLALIIEGTGGASKSPPELRVWNTADWSEQAPLPLPNGLGFPVQIAPDLRQIADARSLEQVVRIWDPAVSSDPDRIDTPISVRRPWWLEFAPDGETLAVGKIDGTIDLWSVRSRQLQATLRAHSSEFFPQAILIGSGSKTVVSFGRDWYVQSTVVARATRRVVQWVKGMGRLDMTEVIVWDMAAHVPRYRIPGEESPVLSANGKVLATVTTEGTVQLRDVPDH
jgi:WD40 repeat protein